MNIQKRSDYKFLFKTLLKWYREKGDYYFEVIEEPLQHVEDSEFLKLGLSREEFKRLFIEPYKRFDLQQLMLIGDLQTSFSKEISDKFLSFQIKPFDTQYMNALEWTLVNIKDLFAKESLNFSYDGEDDVIEYFYKEPYKQCIYCGKPNKDKRGKDFGIKGLKICHVDGCITSNSNTGTEFHQEGCCHLEWKRIKKNFDKKLYDINKNFLRIPERQKLTIKLFEDFCEQRFNANLSMNWTIQTENEEAREVKSVRHKNIEIIGTIN